ncbi:MAG TPA: type II toxin-antitoxin system PemK/MazF family toxin [Candidatus Marinimicrobia bacterium]|nr:type II toxin-antitoxin system PemK/MazF family toxin [Candidatus Neomarinimicrobiota bacterium]HQE96411.1 type II toxin-antitoxin system PemK/MazF family toxin [Candidatus Neomarinimicrobiota bacterium]HQH56950.1 type II toxin-antitoxin system PemK/MazF family toxin [Candidatus Neomarinimicrobiota bacterium]HRS52926.1 type II toxin-antitoxin system PemK/MazF family toxin [Candidatus Neomarinimicrobiota bacterium]
MVEPLRRGDVYLVNLDPTVGFEMGKLRPAMVVQNNIGNQYSPVTIIAPISSVKEITKPLPVMVFLSKEKAGLDADSYIDCGQIRTVDKANRLIHKVGELPAEKIAELDRAIKISLALQ